MVVKLQGTEHKAAVPIAAHSPVGPGAMLHQGSSSSSPQNAAVSLAEEGKNRGKMPKVRQQSGAADGSSAAQQQKRSFSLKSVLGLKKTAKPTPQAQPAAAHHKGATLRDLLAQEDTATQHDSASPDAAHLTRSGGVKRHDLDDMAGRPMVKGGSGEDKLPTQHKQQQLNNFSQMRQTVLSKLANPATPSQAGTAEITQDDDDSEFQQLHQQRLAREQENPPPSPRLGVATPLAARFQPRLTPVAESVLEGTNTTPSPLRAQSALRGSGAEMTPLSMTLDKGKLQLASTNPPALNTLLMQTLNKADQHYMAHHASSDGSQHLLLDKQGRLFDIKSDATGYSVMHNKPSGELKAKLAQATEATLSVDSKSGKVLLSMGAESQQPMTLRQPGDMHRSMLTGIWQHSAGAAKPPGESIRLQDNKIHILHPELGVWQCADKESHSQLSRQADGKLYALQDSRTLQNLSDNKSSEKLVDKIKSFAVSERGQVAILTDTASRHQMSFMPAVDAPPESRISASLHFADPHQALQHGQLHLEAQSVALSHGRLIVADSEGKLFSAALPKPGESEVKMKAMPQPALEQHLGHDHQISGFFTDDHGQLNALVKDNFKQQHACPLGDDHQFHPGWNLSDALVIDNQLGLHRANPEPHEVLDMGQLGSLTLQEGKVHYFDQLTRGWSSAEPDCQQLKKGLDGAAYILKEGEVKRLDINQSTSSIKQGADNIFSLPHVRNKPEAGSALKGLDKADKAQAMAVIGVNKYLALSEKGDIRSFQIKPGSQQLARPAQTLSREGLSGELKDIHVDHQQDLYALNHNGEVFHQPRAGWQNGAEGSGWQKMALPQGESQLQRLDMNHEHHPVATCADGSQHLLKADGGWHAYTPPERGPLAKSTSGSQEVFTTLSQAVKGKVIPGSGVTVKASAQTFGLSGAEGRKVSSKFADRIRAYVFNPTMATPRPIKNAAYATQHNWQGRQGLRPLYEMQGALIKQLDAHNVRHNAPQPDLHSKLASLDLGEHGAALLKDMKRFADELEQSATRSATVLGQHQGVLKSSGEINNDYQPAHSKGLVQSFNVNRSGRDLSQSLQQAVRATPPSAQSKLDKMLGQFVSAGVNMSHQKGEIPLGRQRDPNDKTALTKSRLILDTVTLGELHQLADKAALVSGHQPDAGQIKQLHQQFDTLREKQYGANPVKQYTDMGFTHNKALEADYDAVKAFINAFKKEHHGVNLTTRTVLQTQGNAELAKKLKDTLLSLGSGESISFSRAYGGGLSSAFVPALNKVPVPVIPGAGITLDRAYNLSFSRTSGGLSVNFGRDGGGSGSVSVSTGQDLMPYMTDKKTSAGNASDWLSKKHKISPDFRIGGGVSATVQSTLQNSLKFKLTEDELPDFIHGLTHGTLTPAELMQKGIEHQMKQGSKLTFSVDTSAALDLRAGISLTENGSKPNSATARASAGLSASANLVAGSRERSTTAGEFGSTTAASDNRPTFFNQAGLGANLTLAAGAAHSSTHEGKALGTFAAFSATSVSLALAMDNRTSQSISLELKHAQPVTHDDISELTATLGKHFKDSATTQLLAAVKDSDNAKPAEQLAVLQQHFNAQPIAGDERYEAVRSLNKLALRQRAVDSNSMELGSAGHSTSYKNLSRLDKNGIFALLHKHFDTALPPGSASRLSALMDGDPALKGLIKQLQTTPFSSASVTMELKDDVRDNTERAMLEGKVGREEVGILFQDRNNLRIKSVSVSQSISKSEGFNTPTLLLGASNSAGMSMERNIGTINFKYGQDQNTPRRFTLEGDIARADPKVASALAELKKEGLEMKS